MELDERPTEQYSDIGGLDKQIEEVGLCAQFVGLCVIMTIQLVEAIVLPMTHKQRFEDLGIQPPKGSV